VSEKIDKRGKETEEKIARILSEAKNETSSDKLTQLLEDIEKENEGDEISEENKEKIGELKEKILNFDPQSKAKMINKINNSLLQNGLSEEDLDEEARGELASLKEEEGSNKEIIKKEESLTEKIGIAGAKKKLDELVEKAKNYLKKNLFDKVREVKKEMVQFIGDKGYNHKAYLVNKSEVDQIFAQVENTSSEKNLQVPAWKKAVVPVSLLVGVMAIVMTAVMVVKRKQK
jgi:hypothetical protein